MSVLQYKCITSYRADLLSSVLLCEIPAPYPVDHSQNGAKFLGLLNFKVSADPSFSDLHQKLKAEKNIHQIILLLNDQEYLCAGTNRPDNQNGICNFCHIGKLPKGSFRVTHRATEIIQSEFSQHGDWLLHGFYRYLLANPLHLHRLGLLDSARLDRTLRTAIQELLQSLHFSAA